jgi:hypothetical protein
MLVRDAKKLCPELVTVPCAFDKYEKVILLFFLFTQWVLHAGSSEDV